MPVRKIIHDDVRDLDILSRTLYGEAEANNERDAISIANVICNRTEFKNWPNSISAVCLQPYQFSCWNANDPNRQRIMDASGEWFEKCKQIAAKEIQERASGISNDPTFRSTHYYETGVKKKPAWAKGKQPVAFVNHKSGTKHIFFNDIDTPPPNMTAAEALDKERPLVQTTTMKTGMVAAVGTPVAAAAGGKIIDTIMDHSDTAVSLISTLAQYTPQLLIGLVFVAGIVGFLVWNRYRDRQKGKI